MHGNGAFAHAGGDPFHGTVANVTGGKDSGNAGFRPVGGTDQGPTLRVLSFTGYLVMALLVTAKV